MPRKLAAGRAAPPRAKSPPVRAKSPPRAKSPKRAIAARDVLVPSSARGWGAFTAGWGRVEPPRTKQRQRWARELPECFLSPEDAKYPVCPVVGATMRPVIVSQGVATAYQRSIQHARPDVTRKALALARKHEFEWLRHVRQ